jgi:hypothetical protein
MRIIQYTPEHFDSLRRAAAHRGVPGLEDRSFVDYYYVSVPWCRLYMAVGKDGTVEGTIGVECLPFEYDSRQITFGLATNFHAFQPGLGGYLYIKWVNSCSGALEFGGTEDAHRVIRSTGNWTYFSGIKQYVLNYPFPPYASDPWWRRAAKKAARTALRRNVRHYAQRISPALVSAITVQEEEPCPSDILPRRSPFRFRLAPTVEYLRWRYHTRLPFIRYRLFRILKGGSSSGYVILSDSRDRIIVAQCDAEDPTTLACGVLLSVLEAARSDRRPRTVLLTSAHPGMQTIYTQFGFEFRGEQMRFAIGRSRGPVDISPDTTNWLVNFDWGDTGLLDELEERARAQSQPLGMTESGAIG